MQNQNKGYSQTCSQAATVKTTLEPPIQVKPLDDKANRADKKKLCVKPIPKLIRLGETSTSKEMVWIPVNGVWSFNRASSV